MKRVFLSGGCKNGKSTLAQYVARAMKPADHPMYYIATMDPHDDEDLSRIQHHLSDRAGWGFETLEQPYHILDCLNCADVHGSFLLDSVTAILSNEMFTPNFEIDKTAPERVRRDLLTLAQRVDHIVFVSDFMTCDAMEYDPYTEAYRAALARIDRELAGMCDTVAELCAAQPLVYKGALEL